MGSKNTTQTKTVDYPSYVTSAVQQALGSATSAASTPYNPYPGQLVAPLNAAQNAGIAGVAGTVGAAQPDLNAAQGMIGNINPVNPTAYSPGAVQQYESPYNQDVINATQQQFNLSNQQQQQALTGNAASNHALGGDRVGVAQAQLAGQQDTAQAATIAGLNNQNYQQALNEFNTQQQTGMAAQEANNYTNLYGAGELGNLGQLQLGTGLQGYGALMQAGGLQQNTQQAQDTAAQQQYLTAQQYPFQTAQYLSGISGQLGSLYSGDTTTQTTQPSNIFGQIAGLGLSAAGLGAFGSGGLLGGLFGPSMDSGYLQGGYKRGGGMADGGDVDDSDDAPAPDMGDDAPDTAGPSAPAEDDSQDYSPTSGFEDSTPDEQIGDDTLAGIASGEDADTAGLNGADMAGAGAPSGIAAAPQGQGSLGLDAKHMALLQAGLGMMASKNSSFLGSVGEGGAQGLKAYEQERLMEGQMGYRQAMSQAATRRSEALAQHYSNVDSKPKFDTSGATGKWVYPDGHIQDTGIPVTAFQRAQTADAAQKDNAAYHKGLLNRPDMMVVGTDDSDPAHPKVMMADRHNPSNIITTDAAPKTAGAGSGGVTGALVSQLIKDNPKLSTQDALSIIKDPSGQHAGLVNNATDRLVQSAATHDPAYQDDPVATMNKWKAYYKTAPAAAAAKPNPNGAPNPNHQPPPAPVVVPPAYINKLDGFQVMKGGVTYTKKGNQLVPGG